MEAFVRPSPFSTNSSRHLPGPTNLVTSKPLLLPHHHRCHRRRRRFLPTASIPASTPSPTPPTPTPPKNARGFMLWGPPGSGKSTLCEALSQTHGLVHISTGSLLRAHVLYETAMGVKARPFFDRSVEVPDHIVVTVVLERLRQVDCARRGFLLDGFPRNVEQQNALNRAGFHYHTAYVLYAPRDTLERRIRYRRLDPETDIIYNLKLRPTESQEVLERLVILDKDRPYNLTELFASYGRSTADIFQLLNSCAVHIDANRDLDDVLIDISKHLETMGVPRMNKMSPFSTHITPRPVLPPDALGRASALSERGAADGKRPASAAAALRARPTTTQDDPLVSDTRKSPISLIRCDGYLCERESVEESQIAFRGAATEQVMLVWNRRPTNVLLLVKRDPSLMVNVLEAAHYLIEVEKMNVIVEPSVQTSALANGLFLDTFTSSETLHEKVDFVVCLGGDGLILHVSRVFQTAVPPVISFNLGSLGFLTPFQMSNFKAEITEVLKGNLNLSLRMRLTCGIIRKGVVEKKLPVLNEVVIDRGSSPYLSNLDCFCDGKYITTVQADGIIMSTPTGSTAYSMSAGGSMVHPSVPAILFTPICPHSLSFRPIVFPDSAKLQIEISEDARSHAWASFDGKSRLQLKRGDGLLVEMSMFPVPTINKMDHTGDWFQSLDRAFNFNSRAIQKRLPEQRRARPPARENGNGEVGKGSRNRKVHGMSRSDPERSGFIDEDNGKVMEEEAEEEQLSQEL